MSPFITPWKHRGHPPISWQCSVVRQACLRPASTSSKASANSCSSVEFDMVPPCAMHPVNDVSPHKSREVVAEVQPVVRPDVIDECPFRKNHLTLAVRQSAIRKRNSKRYRSRWRPSR
jgi:hypothetical protein